jgi:hypothetical protein
MADPIYDIPPHTSEERIQAQRDWRTRRAHLLHALVGCVPAEYQTEALDTVLQLEALHCAMSDRITGSWLDTVQQAFLHGIKISTNADDRMDHDIRKAEEGLTKNPSVTH